MAKRKAGKRTKTSKLQKLLTDDSADCEPKRPRTRATTAKHNAVKKEAIVIKSTTNVAKVKQQFSYYDNWYVIKPRSWPGLKTQQRHRLDWPLVKLANAAAHLKLPSERWSSKVTLYKVLPAILMRHTMTIYTGDLKLHKISEQERHKYQPSSVSFQREGGNNKTLDRLVVFKNKFFSIHFDNKPIVLNGAPEAISSAQDLNKLLDIIDSIDITNCMVEVLNTKSK